MNLLGAMEELMRHSRSLILTLIATLTAAAFAGDNPSNLSPSQMPGETYLLHETYLAAIVEAEKLPGAQSSSWVFETDATRPENGDNYLGDGFLRYVGPRFTGVHPDADHTRQGDKDTWLVFKVKIPAGQGGMYKMLVRKSHVLEDGDNDCWIGFIGMPQSTPIGRYGWGGRGTFNWGNTNMEDNPDGFPLVAGLNAVYVAGRSKDFCVDRISIYKAEGGLIGYAQSLIAPESPTEGSTAAATLTPLRVMQRPESRRTLTVDLRGALIDAHTSGACGMRLRREPGAGQARSTVRVRSGQ
ncbi:MAG: hypothetical protein GF331_15885 [Chitinivibrionales bacterium]|nr:hypothetical protein [Chitinivibrionales bacterium]